MTVTATKRMVAVGDGHGVTAYDAKRIQLDNKPLRKTNPLLDDPLYIAMTGMTRGQFRELARNARDASGEPNTVRALEFAYENEMIGALSGKAKDPAFIYEVEAAWKIAVKLDKLLKFTKATNEESADSLFETAKERAYLEQWPDEDLALLDEMTRDIFGSMA